MNRAIAIWQGKSSEAALGRVRADRAAAEQRIAELEAKRAAELRGEGDLAAIDLIDASIAAERRTIAIANQREAIVEKELRQQNRDRRDAGKTAAVKAIAALYGRRTAKGKEIVATIARLAELAHEIKDDKQVAALWPFHAELPSWFDWRHDFNRDLMEALRAGLGDLMPGDVKQAIGYRTIGSGTGIVQAPPDTPAPPDDLPGQLAHHAKHILDSLRKVKINDPEPDQETDDETEVAA